MVEGHRVDVDGVVVGGGGGRHFERVVLTWRGDDGLLEVAREAISLMALWYH